MLAVNELVNMLINTAVDTFAVPTFNISTIVVLTVAVEALSEFTFAFNTYNVLT